MSYVLTLCVGRSIAFAGQYVLHCPATREISKPEQYNYLDIALEWGQYLDIVREDGFHLSFDLHFDL